MTREPLIDTLRRHGTEPQFDLATFRHGLITDRDGHPLQWHYGDSDCPHVKSPRLRKLAGVRVVENLVEFLRVAMAARCGMCHRSAIAR